MKCYVWKPCSDQPWQYKLQFLIWRSSWFFEQSAFVNNHLLSYWPTIHNLILKICSKFQVLSSHFFEFDELLHEQWVKLCEVKLFQLQSMLHAISINQRFVFMNSGILCLALIFDVNNMRMEKWKKIDCRLQNTICNIPFFSVHWYKCSYIAVLPIFFFFLDFFSGDLALTEL